MYLLRWLFNDIIVSEIDEIALVAALVFFEDVLL